MTKKIALFPGSFDPLHEGHIHIIKKAINIFDKLIICVSININKKNTSNLLERTKQVKKIISNLKLKNVNVILWDKYIVDVAKKHKAKYLIVGVRNQKDFKQSLFNASVNKTLNPSLETIVFFSDEAYKKISSSKIKETLKKHEDFFKTKK